MGGGGLIYNNIPKSLHFGELKLANADGFTLYFSNYTNETKIRVKLLTFSYMQNFTYIN